MKHKKNIDEKISEALNVDFEEDREKTTNNKEPKKIVVKKEDMISLREKHSNSDYSDVRSNLKDLIDVGRDAVDGIIKVAEEGDHPRAYEVAGQMIKTVADMNKDLIDLHKQMKELKKEEVNINHNTHNSIYVGSTSDLQDLINQSRSAKKAITNNIIDVEEVSGDDN